MFRFFFLFFRKYSKIYSLFLIAAAPQRPKIEHEGLQVPPGHNVTVDSKAVATVSCVSHYGNPAATLKWFLGKCWTIERHGTRAHTTPHSYELQKFSVVCCVLIKLFHVKWPTFFVAVDAAILLFFFSSASILL